MKNGTFVNYQLAEAILYIKGLKEENKSPEEINEALSKLKRTWKNDIIPSTGMNVPDLFGMQDLTLEQVEQLSSELEEYDTYTVENCASMQQVLKRSSDGSVEFDFSTLDKVVLLARLNGKKIVIDSAVVHGDHFPEMLKDLSGDEIKTLISRYITELTSRYGDIIERIDVLNAIFERQDVKGKDGISVEDFWKEKLGTNYGKEIIDISSTALGGKNIPLCWNEFYITREKYADRKERFLSTVSNIENLDIIGIQDAFQDTSDMEYITSVFEQIGDICRTSGKKMAITECGCMLSRGTIEGLYSTLQNNPSNTTQYVGEVEQRINEIIGGIKDYASQSDFIMSTEGRISKELDYYSHRPELNAFKDATGLIINTVGEKNIRKIENVSSISM